MTVLDKETNILYNGFGAWVIGPSAYVTWVYSHGEHYDVFYIDRTGWPSNLHGWVKASDLQLHELIGTIFKAKRIEVRGKEK